MHCPAPPHQDRQLYSNILTHNIAIHCVIHVLMDQLSPAAESIHLYLFTGLAMNLMQQVQAQTHLICFQHCPGLALQHFALGRI